MSQISEVRKEGKLGGGDLQMNVIRSSKRPRLCLRTQQCRTYMRMDPLGYFDPLLVAGQSQPASGEGSCSTGLLPDRDLIGKLLAIMSVDCLCGKVACVLVSFLGGESEITM